MSNRRDLLTFLGSAAVAWPVAARAQPTGDVRRIAVLMGTATNELRRSYLATFMQRLEQLGWANGRNVHVETRWWAGTLEQMRLVVAELLALSPEVIMAFSNPAVALLKATKDTVPIVFVGVGDPIGDGFVASLAHPGRNITGFAGTDGPIGGKWLEVLKETAPQVNRVMMIMHPETPIHQAFWRSLEAAAPRLGVEVTPGGVHDAAKIARSILSFAAKENGGIVLAPHAITWANEDLIIALALQHRMPSHYATAASVKAAALSAMVTTSRMLCARRRTTSIASFAVKNRATFRFRCLPSSGLSSISRPPKRLASTCRRRCSPAPTK